MSVYRITALVLSSMAFFPVSCTTGLVVGTIIIATKEARDSLKGEKPHSQAYLVAVIPGDPKKIEALPFYDLNDFKTRNPSASFLLPAELGRFPLGADGDTISYVAKKKDPETQIIEVTRQGESEAFFRYEATDKSIKPMYSKLWHHAYMFGALPLALGFAAGLRLVGRRMRRGLADDFGNSAACPKCGTNSKNSEKVCSKCGATLPESSRATLPAPPPIARASNGPAIIFWIVIAALIYLNFFST